MILDQTGHYLALYIYINMIVWTAMPNLYVRAWCVRVCVCVLVVCVCVCWQVTCCLTSYNNNNSTNQAVYVRC